MRTSLERGRARTSLISECKHPPAELKGAGNQYRREIYCNLCKGRWEHLTPEELQKRKDAVKSPGTPTASSFMTAGPMGVKCLCGRNAHRWEVKKRGPTQGRHFFRCQNRVCDFFQWDQDEQQQAKVQMEWEDSQAEKLQEEVLKIQSQAEDHVQWQAQEMQRTMQAQAEQMNKEYQDRMEAQANKHQQELAEVRAQMAWMQGFLAQVQSNQAAQSDGFSLVSDPSV